MFPRRFSIVRLTGSCGREGQLLDANFANWHEFDRNPGHPVAGELVTEWRAKSQARAQRHPEGRETLLSDAAPVGVERF
jgi:hypothetical protein